MLVLGIAVAALIAYFVFFRKKTAAVAGGSGVGSCKGPFTGGSKFIGDVD